jgi:DNA cross-link repair 1C protein
MSTFNGEIIELPGVCVDKFNDNNFKVYFLSHCHTDHLQGLQKPKQIKFFVYCTELSAHFLKQKFPQHEEQIRIVSVGSPLLIQEEGLNFQATFIPAGHCAGSCKHCKNSINNKLINGSFF